MRSKTETLLAFKGFATWNWEAEFQQALLSYKPDADDILFPQAQRSRRNLEFRLVGTYLPPYRCVSASAQEIQIWNAIIRLPP